MKKHGLTTHGHSKRDKISSEYRAWYNMKYRCYNPNIPNYKNYGAKGVTVCDRWLDSFENFLADMGEKPTPKHTIERKDPTGNYEPDNCRWATYKEQANNKRMTTRVIYNGQEKTISEWADTFGLDWNVMYMRYITNGTQDFDKPLYFTYPAHRKIHGKKAAKLGI